MDADRLAPFYRFVEYAAFGSLLQKCRTRHFELLRGARRVLVLGEGDGRALAELVRATDGEIVVVEASREMVRLARGRVVGARIRFVVGDARLVEFDRCDAVVTNFFLDCFEESEARELIRRVVSCLEPGGLWLLGDFRIPASGWRRVHASVWVWIMYGFFRVVTGLEVSRLADFEGLLEEAGLIPVQRQEWRFGMIVAAVFRRGTRAD